MADENYSNFTTIRLDKGFYYPDQPESHREEKKEGKGARAREKKKKGLATVFSFYIVAFRGQTHSQTRT